jgi:hypothetical protein
MALLEPEGGNVYHPHPFMIDSGTFWRCAHGSTGYGGGDKLKWIGCVKCKADDPEAYALFHKNDVAQVPVSLLKEIVEIQGECHFDHHGYCQAHNLQTKDDCWVARLNKIIEE